MAKKVVLKNKKEEYFELRKLVMNFIYEAKSLLNGIETPRVEVKICYKDESKNNVIGQGYLNQYKINISEAWLDKSDNDIRTLVYHELVHTWFKYAGHDESCVLMSSVITKGLSKKTVQKTFLKYCNLSHQIESCAA